MKILIFVTLALTLANAFNFNLSESETVPKGRVLNGQDAEPKQIPYIVGLRTKHSNAKSTWCSGSLIHKEWILTAAHCLEDVVKVDVLLGASSRKNYAKKTTVSAKDTITHKKNNPVDNKHDIGLVKIPSVAFTNRIRAIKLPKRGDSNYVGKKVLIAGWGDTNYNKGPVDTLQWGRMEVISNDELVKIDKKLKLGLRIPTKAINGVHPCMGDSGGPVVLESNPNILIGVSAEIPRPGCDTSLPALATNVQAHLSWIKKKIYERSNKIRKIVQH